MGVYIELPKEWAKWSFDVRDIHDNILVAEVTDLDLVRCGECKNMRKYALRSDEPMGIWCHRWSVPRLVTDDDFCSYGERRADETQP